VCIGIVIVHVHVVYQHVCVCVLVLNIVAGVEAEMFIGFCLCKWSTHLFYLTHLSSFELSKTGKDFSI